jgi:hypothetical protein
MLFGKPLFTSKDKQKIFADILSCNFSVPKTISFRARNFLLCMLKKEGINRLSASQLLVNEFIVGDYHKFKYYDVNTFKNYNINSNRPTNNNKNVINNMNINANYNLNMPINKQEIKHYPTESNFKYKDKQKMVVFPILVNNKNIINTLYKCSTCFGLNICENCYFNSYKNHIHNFIKNVMPVKLPNQQFQQNPQLINLYVFFQ